ARQQAREISYQGQRTREGIPHPDHWIEQLDRRIQRPDRQLAARACHDEISTGPGSVWNPGLTRERVEQESRTGATRERVEQESRNWKIASEQRTGAGSAQRGGTPRQPSASNSAWPLSLAMMPGCPCSKAALTHGFLRTGECPRGPVS